MTDEQFHDYLLKEGSKKMSFKTNELCCGEKETTKEMNKDLNIIDLDKVDEKNRDLNELRKRMSKCDMEEARAIAEVIFNLYPAIYIDVLGVEVGHLVEVSHKIDTVHTIIHNRKDTVYGKE